MGAPVNRDKPNIVIDTNVLIDAMVARVSPQHSSYENRLGRFVTDWAFKHYNVCFTEQTMLEFATVALDMRDLTRMPPSQAFERKGYVDLVQRCAVKVEPKFSERVSRDRNDQMILRAAAGADAAYIISRDKGGILCLKGEGNRQFLSPHAFAHSVIGKDALRNFNRQEVELAGQRKRHKPTGHKGRSGFPIRKIA